MTGAIGSAGTSVKSKIGQLRQLLDVSEEESSGEEDFDGEESAIEDEKDVSKHDLSDDDIALLERLQSRPRSSKYCLPHIFPES